jgi:transposase
MARTNKRYSEEFKVEAVRLLKESGKTLHDQARVLGVDPSTLWNWKKDLEPESSSSTLAEGAVVDKDEEIRRLRRENEILRQERDFLKKATAFFAKESR